jgi:hypothetical protein
MPFLPSPPTPLPQGSLDDTRNRGVTKGSSSSKLEVTTQPKRRDELDATIPCHERGGEPVEFGNAGATGAERLCVGDARQRELSVGKDRVGIRTARQANTGACNAF